MSPLQTKLPGATSQIDTEISQIQNEIKALDRSILAQQQRRSALSGHLDSLLAAKEKSDMYAPLPSRLLLFPLSSVDCHSSHTSAK
jgi:hypothetical protein